MVARNVKTECKLGHSYTADNTYFDGEGLQRCRACIKIRQGQVKLRNSKAISSKGYQMRKLDGVWQRKVDGKWQSLQVTTTDVTKLSNNRARQVTPSRPRSTMPRRLNVWSWS